jgi:type II secretory ATPase GspE/PulE/Tfp pilus assembly ATPase PilB-like protein
MVGEIRDAETAEIAINAALTGHLVFSTLHTNDASGAVTRLTNMGIEPFLTASTVVMVIAQRLVRVICDNCKEDYQVPAQFIRDLGQKYEDDKPVLLYRGKGCDRCTNTGYRGRLACYEIMVIEDEIRDLVLERASTHLVKQKSREHGMVTLRESAFRKVLNGVTTVEEMMRVTFVDAG